MNKPYLLLLLMACTGSIGPGESPPNMRTPDGPGDPVDVRPCEGICVAPNELLRITRGEYAATIARMFDGRVEVPISRLPEDTQVATLFAAGDSASSDHAQNYRRVAEQIAETSAPARRDFCAGSVPCAGRLLEHLAPLAFRRPLLSEELATYEELLSNPAIEDDEMAQRLLVEVLLQSPDFLFAPERVEGEDAPSALDGHALALRLARFLTGAPPDDALLDAAARGALDSAEGLEEQALRLIHSEAFDPVLRRFHREWLVGQTAFHPDVPADALVEELETFAVRAFRQEPTLTQLLFDSSAVLSPEAAAHYGVDNGATEVPGHVGVLMRAAVMATHARAGYTRPIFRGTFIRRRLFCRDPLRPPPNAEAMAEEASELLPDDLSPRQVLEALTENEGACASCHTPINALGFAFENFDADGRYRTVDELGRAVDSEGAITQGDVNGSFEDAASFLDLIADSQLVSDCVAKQWFRFALQREPLGEDAHSLRAMQDGLATSNGNLEAMLVALVRSHAFRYRQAP